MKKSDTYEEYFKKIGISEFFHSFKEYGAAIGLRIPTYEVKDINSAITKAKDAGFDGKVDAARGYLEIAKYGYKKEDDQKVVEELKKLAKEVAVSKDYADHIENLQLTLTQSMSKTPISTPESPLSEIKKFGIPMISNEKELPLKKLICFASMHNNTKEGEDLENILNRLFELLEDKKKRVIVLFETISDPLLTELLNNPEADEETIKKYYIPMFGFPEAAEKVVSALRRVLHRYGTERFKIVPIDVTPKEMVNKLINEDEYEKNRDETIVNNVLKWYTEEKNNDNTVIFVVTGAKHVRDICEVLMKKGETDNVCVYVARKSS